MFLDVMFILGATSCAQFFVPLVKIYSTEAHRG